MSKDFNVDFIGIGVAKSGSTSIARILKEHPQVNFSIVKETHFFNKRYEKGMDFYETYFRPMKKGQTHKGEFCNHYINDISNAKKIKKHFPNVKILAVLRDPVDRTYSHYSNSKYATKIGQVPKDMSFEEALKKFPDCYEWSKYYKLLKPFYETFPKKNIHIILLDDLKANPKKVVKELYEFVGVDSKFYPPKTFYDMVSRPRSYYLHYLVNYIYRTLPKLGFFLPKETRRKIEYTRFARKYEQFYRDVQESFKKKAPRAKLSDPKKKELYKKHFVKDIDNLEKLIGRDLSMWKYK